MKVAFLCAAILATQFLGRSVTAADYRVYVTNERSGDLTVIDGRTDAVVEAIPLGKRPRGVQVSPDGRWLYVALSGSPIAGPGVDEKSLPPPDKTADGIGVVDLRSRRLVRTLRGVSDPEEFALNKDGSRLYVASEDTGTLVVFETGTGQMLESIPVGTEPEGVALSPDGHWIYATSEAENQVAVIDTRDDSIKARIPVGARPRAIVFGRNSPRAFVSCENDASISVIDTERHEAVGHIVMPDKTMRPMGLALSSNDGTLFVATGRGGQVVVIDARRTKVLKTVKAGARPWGIALSPDGRKVYTANGPSNDVTVFDANTFALIKNIAAGTSPWGLAINAGSPTAHHPDTK